MAETFRTIGKCIYCGSTEPGLSREHALPRGLKGNQAPLGKHEAFVLQAASCKTCREITRKIEDDCLSKGMDNLRNILGWKRKDRPKGIVRSYLKRGDAAPTAMELPPADVGASFLLPVFERPGGPDYGEFNPLTGKFGIHREETKLHSVMRLTPFLPHRRLTDDGSLVAHEIGLSVEQFRKMLAKIAHCCAVQVYGLDGFTPWLPEFIRNLDNTKTNLIGGFGAIAYNESDSSNMHEISVTHKVVNFQHVVYVRLRLFAKFGGPTYIVIAGGLDAVLR